MKIFAALLALLLLSACAAAGKPATYKNAAQWPPKERSEAQKGDPLQTLWPWNDDETKSEAAPAPAVQDAGASAGSAPLSPAPALVSSPPPSSSEGYLVASVDELVPVDMQSLPNAMKGILPLSGSYRLWVKQAGGEPVGTFGCAHNLINLNANDLDRFGRFGFVTVKKLPPGHYEIYGYDVKWREGKDKDRSMNAPAPFSIPFTIEAGKTTYLGSYGAVGYMTENNWGISKPAGAYFLVRDLSDRDIEIAKGKMPELGPLVKDIPDVKTMNNPAFKTGTVAAN